MSTPAAHAPISGWNGFDRLRFSRTERQLLEIVRDHPENEFNRIALRTNRRDLAVELCCERRNCVQWLPVQKTERVLEVGAGAGGLTGVWAGKAAQVVGVELSCEKGYINAVRHRGRDNVEIHCGAFDETEKRLAGRPFDVITLIGSLDTAESFVGAGNSPHQRLLSRLVDLLAEGGRIIVAAPNPFGLKYWAGSAEENTGLCFEGLEGYLASTGVQTFSRAGLERLARESGLENATFFYPYPDYRFAGSIYSDDYLPRKGELCFNGFPWDARRIKLFHQGKVFDELIGENQFPFFSNSFLAVLAKQALPPPPKGDRRTIFTKFSTIRRRQFQIRTDILLDGQGARTIRKLPVCPEGQLHVDGLFRNYEKLSQLYAGSILAVNRCEPRQGGAEFEYLEGPSLADGALEELRRGDREAFLKRMSGFFKTVRSFATEDFRCTDEFRAVFGNVRLPAGLKSAPVSDVDLILPNVLVRNGQWNLIDYEWTFDFPVPVGYVLFRTLRYLYSYNDWIGRRYAGLHAELYRMAGIEQEFRRYKLMEWSFQNHIVPKPSFIQDIVSGELLVPKPKRSSLTRFLVKRLPWKATEWLVKAKAFCTDLP